MVTRETDPVAPLAPTHAGLWLPSAGLAGCVRATVTRDTQGVALQPAQRYSHFPASPLCKLVWWLSGDGEVVEPAASPQAEPTRRPVPHRAMFYGPSTRPVVGYSDGPVSVLMVLLMPDALQALTGLSPADWIDREAALADALGPDWSALAPAFAAMGGQAGAAGPSGPVPAVVPSARPGDAPAAPDDAMAARVAMLHAWLLPRWQACRADGAWASHRYRDWAEALALRAARSAPGRSLRQMERRIRAWAGQPMRELHGLVKAEEAFFAGAAARTQGPVAWAEVAADAGYADQSHLCRATRRVTGFSPQALARRIEDDEAFWPYRVWL